MAAKKLDIFRKTEGDLDAGKIQATGVGLRQGELAALEALGAELGNHLNAEPVARNTLMRIAIRRLLESYLAGELTLDELGGYFETPEKPQPKLKF